MSDLRTKMFAGKDSEKYRVASSHLSKRSATMTQAWTKLSLMVAGKEPAHNEENIKPDEVILSQVARPKGPARNLGTRETCLSIAPYPTELTQPKVTLCVS